MTSMFENARRGTIYGMPVGKWQLGTIAPNGTEAALGPKWIGEAPTRSYPSYSVGIPERLQVSPDLLMGILIGVAANWLYFEATKRRRR